jgi:hypothetical protein
MNTLTETRKTWRDLMESGKRQSRRGAPITERNRIPVGIRMTPDMREKLVERSGAKGRSITQEIELLLEQALFMEWVRVGTQASGLWYDVLGQADARGTEEAARRGISGDWSSDPEARRAAMMAVVHRMLQSLPEFDLEAESGRVVKAMFESALASEHYRRKGPRPGEGVVEQPEPKKNDPA